MTPFAAYLDPGGGFSPFLQWSPSAAPLGCGQNTAGGETGPKGGKGGSPRRSPKGVFWSKSLNMARNSPTNASKGYSGPPESIPMVSRTFDSSLIFGRFELGSLSTFFQKWGLKNLKIRDFPRSEGAHAGFATGQDSPLAVWAATDARVFVGPH